MLVYSVNQNNIGFYGKCLSKLDCIYKCVSSYNDFEIHFLNYTPEIIVLDLVLDNTDALSIIKEIKWDALKTQPYVVVCSDNVDDFILISALNAGADEFIDLPINPLLFESKLKVLCKRLQSNSDNAINEDVYVDLEQYKIYVDKQPHTLPRLEFRLVNLLFSQPDKIFSKDEIAAEIWRNKEISSKRTIDIHIRNIRKELGEDIIKTYRGLGYRLKLNS